MQIAPVSLDWYQVRCGCDADHAPTPNETHAAELAAAHACDDAVVAVTVKRYLATCECEGCDWQGNPSETKTGARGQLADHRAWHEAQAPIVEIFSSDGATAVDEEA